MAIKIGCKIKRTKMKTFIAFLNLSFLAVSLLIQSSPFISPQTHWIFSFLSLLIPFIALVNLLLLLIFLILKSKRVIYPILALLVFAVLYLKATFNVSISSVNEKSFKVLSYNVSEFNRPRKYYFDRFWKGDTIMAQSRDIVDFVVNSDAAIKSLQEYYHDSASVIYSTRDKIQANQYNYAHSTKLLRINKARFGVAIFSKFPILNQGELLYSSDNAYNRGVYADVLIHSDTIRIVNVHLESNEMRLSFRMKFLARWKRAQEDRAKQADQIADFIDASPYPVILCGDLNSTPYSYVYKRFSSNLFNAFESKGTGTDETYNNDRIRFLRIDHQFHSSRISCENFETLNSITLSNHFPIVGTYSIEDE